MERIVSNGGYIISILIPARNDHIPALANILNYHPILNYEIIQRRSPNNYIGDTVVLAVLLGIRTGFDIGSDIAAFWKRIITNACDAGRDNHARQAGAIIKRPVPNIGDAIRDRHARQADASTKRIVHNSRDAIPNCHACQISATFKRPMPNYGEAVRDRHARQINTTFKCPINTRDAIWNHIFSLFTYRTSYDHRLFLVKKYSA